MSRGSISTCLGGGLGSWLTRLFEQRAGISDIFLSSFAV